jgi:hypothetical protein
MKQQWKGRTVHTIDLGPEQLQIIEEPGRQVRVLFRGIWLREDPGPGSRRLSEQQSQRALSIVDSM